MLLRYLLILFVVVIWDEYESLVPSTWAHMSNSAIDTADRIRAHGYPAEEHLIITADGYKLRMFRIPQASHLQNLHAQRPLVLLQHGLFCTSDFWVLNGPNDGLPFMLADAGYDVWLGNARGNHYARQHIRYSAKQPDFWRFSWHEIGRYDLAAMLDYALATGGDNTSAALHYIGHSQGTTAFFAFLATSPEYNSRIKTAHMLAPVAYFNNAPNLLVRLLSPHLGHDTTVARLFSRQEFVPYNELLLLMLFNTCGRRGLIHDLCHMLRPLMLTSTQSGGGSNETISEFFAEVYPGGASTDQVLHYMQLHQSADFRMFDFGGDWNMQIYGQMEPPPYRLENIAARTHLWYSDNDTYVAKEDVLRLAARLSNHVLHHIDDPLWGHGDFLYEMRVRQMINQPILDIMNAYEMQLQIKF